MNDGGEGGMGGVYAYTGRDVGGGVVLSMEIATRGEGV